MAANSPSSYKGKRTSMRITPSNSPSLRPSSRSPQKHKYQSNLCLRGVIGSTVTTPNGLSVHGPSRLFALCAGSTVVLAELDENSRIINQRFLRARPSATSFYPAASYYVQFSSPVSSNTTRGRSLSFSKATANGNGNIFNASPAADSSEGVGSRHWSSKERVKAVKCVSISPNGRLLAFGEVWKIT